MKRMNMENKNEIEAMKRVYMPPVTIVCGLETDCLMNQTSLQLPKTEEPVDDEYDPLAKEHNGQQEQNYSLW